MSQLFSPMPRYWICETKELIITALCLRRKFSKDITSCLMMQFEDKKYIEWLMMQFEDKKYIEWLMMWLNHKSWQLPNPLICVNYAGEKGLHPSLVFLVTYEILLEKNMPILDLPQINFTKNINTLCVFTTTECVINRKQISVNTCDVMMGIIIPEGCQEKVSLEYDNKIFLFDNYFDMEINYFEGYEPPKIVEIKKTKVWYTKLGPIKSVGPWFKIASTIEMKISIVNGWCGDQYMNNQLTAVGSPEYE